MKIYTLQSINLNFGRLSLKIVKKRMFQAFSGSESVSEV